MDTRFVVAVLFVVLVAINTTTATTRFNVTTAPALTTNVTNATCGISKYCNSTPSACSPDTPGCYFASARNTSSTIFIELSGNATGYIAAVVSTDSTLGNNDTAYICATNKPSVDFTTAEFNNTVLIPANLPTNALNGTVKQTNITQCTFNISATGVVLIGIYNGSYNAAGDLGNATFLFSLNVTSSSTTTTSATTAATSSGTTTSSATTAALNPVGALTTSISKVGCGTQQLCLSQPASCDPSISGSCYFISSQLLSGQTYQLGLSGDVPGYIATALSTDGTIGNGNIAFVCANNNGTVQFFTANLNGTTLQKTNLAVDSVKGTVNGTKLQCLFSTKLTAGSTKVLNLTVALINGTFDATTGGLGSANIIFQRSADLSNPSSHGITFKQSLMHAMLVVAVALGLTMQ